MRSDLSEQAVERDYVLNEHGLIHMDVLTVAAKYAPPRSGGSPTLGRILLR